MSLCSVSGPEFMQSASPDSLSLRKCESSDDEDKRLRRREKNRVAAQRSRKRQTERADELHEAYTGLEQENSALRMEVQHLLQEQRQLAELLESHEPLCSVLRPPDPAQVQRVPAC